MRRIKRYASARINSIFSQVFLRGKQQCIGLLVPCPMVSTLVFALILLSPPAFSHENIIIDSVQDLETWCKNELRDYYFARQIKLTEWTADTQTQANLWVTKGQGMLDLQRVQISCSVKPGDTESHITIIANGKPLMLKYHELEDDGLPVSSESQLQAWCKRLTHSYLMKKGHQPGRWSAKTVTRGQKLVSKGVWHVGFERKHCQCTVVKGAKRKYVSFEFI